MLVYAGMSSSVSNLLLGAGSTLATSELPVVGGVFDGIVSLQLSAFTLRKSETGDILPMATPFSHAAPGHASGCIMHVPRTDQLVGDVQARILQYRGHLNDAESIASHIFAGLHLHVHIHFYYPGGSGLYLVPKSANP